MSVLAAAVTGNATCKRQLMHRFLSIAMNDPLCLEMVAYDRIHGEESTACMALCIAVNMSLQYC